MRPPGAELTAANGNHATAEPDPNHEKTVAGLREVEKLRAEINQARADLVSVAEQRAKTRAEMVRNESEFKALILSLGAELQNRISANGALEEKIALLEKERELLKTKVTEAATTNLAAVRGEMDALCMRAAELGLNVATLRTERDTLRGDVAQRDEALRHAASGAEATRQELARCRQEQADSVREQERLARTLAAAHGQLKALHARDECVLADLHAHQRELGELKQILNIVSAERDSARGEATQREAAVAAQGERNASLSQELETLKNQVAHAVAERDKSRSEMILGKEQIIGLQERIALLRADLHERGTERDQLRLDLDLARQQRDEAVAQVAARDEELRLATARLDQEALKANQHGSGLQQEIENLRTQLENADRAVAAACQQRDNHAHKAAAHDQEMREISAQLQRHETANQSRHLQLEAAEKECAAALEQLRIYELQREPITAELMELRTAVDQLNRKLDEANNARRVAREEAEHIGTERAALIAQLRSLEMDAEGLRAELEATRAGLERVKQHAVALQSRRDDMREEVARLKMQLGATTFLRA
jgi:chromosome segregation ATPase